MVSASSGVMIKAGSVGTRATYDEPYDENGEETADTEWDEKGRNIISHIYVSYNTFITSIQFGYLNSEDDEALTLSTEFGLSEGHRQGHSFRAVIQKEDEYVTGLSGVHGYGVHEGIRSLTFHTNCGEHGPVGSVHEYSATGFKID
ncbi:unnamed protein product [Eruca vesicaria subsp. sativa]|uniref:Jacalin-type lectin domain-containing protein n=1 Tax=Eruca vesicaria subsp. sativa TaxID=29727 RepID=A0ABC8JLU3_ERUVS|nr:unnamed protein product [Eruca vesicaria subsp. sativa]